MAVRSDILSRIELKFLSLAFVVHSICSLLRIVDCFDDHQPDFDLNFQNESTSNSFEDPWIDFTDIDGDKVVYPYRFEFRNIHKIRNISDHLMVSFYLDGIPHGHALRIDPWQRRIVSSVPVDLSAGEYLAMLLVLDGESEDHLGVESIPRYLVVSSKYKEPNYRTYPRYFPSSLESVGLVTIVITATLSDLNELKGLSRYWFGPISVAVYISLVDQLDMTAVNNTLRLFHSEVEGGNRSALTISLLVARQEDRNVADGAFPTGGLLNLAIETIETELLIVSTPRDRPSRQLSLAMSDRGWVQQIAAQARAGSALIVPHFTVQDRFWQGHVANEKIDSLVLPETSDDSVYLDLQGLQMLHGKGYAGVPNYLDAFCSEENHCTQPSQKYLIRNGESQTDEGHTGKSAGCCNPAKRWFEAPNSGMGLRVDFVPHLAAPAIYHRDRLLQAPANQAESGGAGSGGILEDMCYRWAASGGTFAVLSGVFMHRTKKIPLEGVRVDPVWEKICSTSTSSNISTSDAQARFAPERKDPKARVCKPSWPVKYTPWREDRGTLAEKSQESMNQNFSHAACIINMFGVLPLFFQNLMSGVERKCGCRIRLHQQPQREEDYPPHSIVVLGSGWADPWIAAHISVAILGRMHKAGGASAADLAKIGVVYLGDELGKSWREDLEGSGLADHKYLLQDMPPEPGMRWLPLGCFDGFQARSVLSRIPLELRKYLWTWTGSVNGKPDRAIMLEALENHPRWMELRSRGKVTLTAGWAESVARGAQAYMEDLYETQYAPCPRGTHPETFRIWEALEAGAIPVLVDSPEQALLRELNMGLVWLKSWSDLPDFLLSLDIQDIADHSLYVRRRYSELREKLAVHLDRLICSLKYDLRK